MLQGGCLNTSGKIDWTVLKRLTTPQGVKDLDRFLDDMPVNVGYNALIAAGVAWIIAGCAVFFTAMQVENVSKLRADLMEVEALKPPVPILKYTPVADAVLKELEEKIKITFSGIGFIGSGGKVTLSAQDTDYFPQFLGAVSFLQNGGRNWRVKIDTMCVGRDCTSSKLAAVLTVEQVRVDIPQPEGEVTE